MAQLPSALPCQASSPSNTRSPARCTAKSMIVVVPPHAAARVPVSNVSEANVPPNGSSMCVCASTPPGMTYLPRASMTRSADDARSAPSAVDPGCTSATTRSPSMSTSAATAPLGETTVPLVMSVVMRSSLREGSVHVGTAIPVELPQAAHLGELVEVEVADHELLHLVARGLTDELPARVDE